MMMTEGKIHSDITQSV